MNVLRFKFFIGLIKVKGKYTQRIKINFEIYFKKKGLITFLRK
jgi:hypothetical protein